jgi:asparagine synthase (glutamine-hydrolysing)
MSERPSLAQNAGSGPAAARLTLIQGRPRFLDPALRQLACEQGMEVAWRQAVHDSARHAASGADGEFAVGLTDSLGRSFLAVDRFATLGLCWRVIGDQLHFAERADTLADLAPRPEVDPQSLFDYLYFHVIPSPRTVYRGIYRLPPGHSLWFENGQIQIDRYWAPEFVEAPASLQTQGAAFRDLLAKAVERQLSNGKPACFLSGGTDSSTVAGMTKQVAGKVSTYSIGFAAEGYDEMQFARIAARHFGTDHHEYYVSPEDLIRSIPSVATHYDQPFGNSSVLPAYYCARMAREDGATRLLAGDGGDELFGGNTRYAKQQVFGLYDAVPGPLRTGLLEPLLLRTPAGRLPLLRKARSYIQQATVPMPARMHTYNLLERLGMSEVLAPEFLAQITPAGPAARQAEVWAESQGASLLNRMLHYDWRYTLAECDLPKVQGSTALAGVEVGFPLLDADLVDFSLRLPSDFKVRRLQLRWFFKQALRDFLPEEIIRKKKQGFGLPFGVWAASHSGLNRFARESLASLAERRIVQPAFVNLLINELLPSHGGYYGEMVWILVMLEHWLRGDDARRRTPPLSAI